MNYEFCAYTLYIFIQFDNHKENLICLNTQYVLDT